MKVKCGRGFLWLAALVMICAAGPAFAQGSIVAWGDNTYGQCNLPSPNSGFIEVAGGGYHSLGLRSDGSIVAWGYNEYGQCDVPSPNSGFAAVAAGYHHSLGLKSDGSIVAWGYNEHGECSVPSPNSGFVAVAASYVHSLGLRSDGSIAAWGYNCDGQCNVPDPNSGFVAVAAGYHHSLGLKSDGSIAAWGRSGLGQCDVPDPNADFVAVAGGKDHSLGLKSDGSIVAWGDNYYGQCNVPDPNSGFIEVAGGGYHSLGIRQAPFAIPEAKLAADGSVVVVKAAVVSAAWDDVFYIEADDRSCGTRVEKTAHGLSHDNTRADVWGTLQTNDDGERYISAAVARVNGAGAVSPIGMTTKSVGGGDWKYAAGAEWPQTLRGQKGVVDAVGLNNIGLLVTVWGQITERDSASPATWFKIDDGSGIGVKCVVPGGVDLDPGWIFARVTGISSCTRGTDGLLPLVRARDQSDVTGW